MTNEFLTKYNMNTQQPPTYLINKDKHNLDKTISLSILSLATLLLTEQGSYR